MDWNEWKPLYDEIVRELNIDSSQDRQATKLLSQLIIDIEPAPLIAKMKRMLSGHDVVVFGSGPSLEKHIEHVMNDPVLSSAIYVAADGATSALMENDARCEIVVTDLDGDMDDIQSAMNNDALVVVHAHGDNIPLVTRYVPEMQSVLGSTQVEPLSNVFLWGGFTDGDRACYLVSHYNPKRIILAGMDFGETVGRWSKPEASVDFSASPRKRTKLVIAQTLLTRLWNTSGIPHLEL
jgi:uncharacterized Rossmann fold enzyme